MGISNFFFQKEKVPLTCSIYILDEFHHLDFGGFVVPPLVVLQHCAVPVPQVTLDAVLPPQFTQDLADSTFFDVLLM